MMEVSERPKARITFEVDQSELFDRLRDMKGNFGPLGERLVGILLTGNASFADALGMSIYGVELVKQPSGGRRDLHAR